MFTLDVKASVATEPVETSRRCLSATLTGISVSFGPAITRRGRCKSFGARTGQTQQTGGVQIAKWLKTVWSEPTRVPPVETVRWRGSPPEA